MLYNWIYRTWRHNRTHTKLDPLTRFKHRPHWLYAIMTVLIYKSLGYSYQGIIHDIFPNLPVIKRDVYYSITTEIIIRIKKKIIRYINNVT